MNFINNDNIKKCELCSTTQRIEIHHVQTCLLGISSKYNITQKTMTLCKEHHLMLHHDSNKFNKYWSLMTSLKNYLHAHRVFKPVIAMTG